MKSARVFVRGLKGTKEGRMDASLALRRQFARNFANNSVRIVLGTTSLASKWVAKGCNPPKQKPTA